MRRLALAHLVAALALAPPAAAQDHPPAAPAAAPTTANLQGDPHAFMADPHIRAFYELSVASLRPAGGTKVDVDGYEQKAFAIFRDFGEATGVGAAHMQDHLKLIPRQVVKIAQEDPKVLDSFEAFSEALIGPP